MLAVSEDVSTDQLLDLELCNSVKTIKDISTKWRNNEYAYSYLLLLMYIVVNFAKDIKNNERSKYYNQNSISNQGSNICLLNHSDLKEECIRIIV